MISDVEKLKTDRIGLMIEAVTKAASGDLSIRLETSGQDDELDSLARAINALLNSVQEGRREDSHLYERKMDASASTDMSGQVQETDDAFQALSGSPEKELQRFRFCIDQAADAVYWMDRERKFIYVNDEACHLLGYSREELLKLKASDIDPVFSREQFNQDWAEYKNDGQIRRRYFETWHQRKDGMLIPVEIASMHLWLDDIEYHVAFARDITKRKQMERELYLTQYCVDKASIGIHRSGPDGRFLSVNEKLCKNLGYTREELCNMYVYEIDPDFTREKWLAHRQGLRVKGSQTFEAIHQRKDGTTFPVEITATYLEYEHEGFSFSFTRDITQRKQMEEQLMQARKMESIGQLAGGVAHHFNNMLTVILGYAELLKDGFPSDDPLLEGILAIEKAAIHSRDITRQLLAFSRKQMIAPRLLNLNELITQTKPSLVKLIGEDIDLRFYPGQNLWLIKFDPAQLDQILNNLAANARDALPNGGKLTIETQNISLDEAYCQNNHEFHPGHYVCLTVSDNGLGMNQETLPHLFEPFFTTKEVGQGTGLGLATIYGIIKQNDGAITVDSKPGHGTTLKIYFPKVG